MVAAAPCAHPDGRRLSVRRMYASRRKCYRHQRSKCRYEYPSGFREFLRPLCPDTFVDGFIADMLAMTRGGAPRYRCHSSSSVRDWKRFCQQFSATPSGSARQYWCSSLQPYGLLSAARNRDGGLPVRARTELQRFAQSLSVCGLAARSIIFPGLRCSSQAAACPYGRPCCYSASHGETTFALVRPRLFF